MVVRAMLGGREASWGTSLERRMGVGSKRVDRALARGALGEGGEESISERGGSAMM